MSLLNVTRRCERRIFAAWFMVFTVERAYGLQRSIKKLNFSVLSQNNMKVRVQPKIRVGDHLLSPQCGIGSHFASSWRIVGVAKISFPSLVSKHNPLPRKGCTVHCLPQPNKGLWHYIACYCRLEVSLLLIHMIHTRWLPQLLPLSSCTSINAVCFVSITSMSGTVAI